MSLIICHFSICQNVGNAMSITPRTVFKLPNGSNGGQTSEINGSLKAN